MSNFFFMARIDWFQEKKKKRINCTLEGTSVPPERVTAWPKHGEGTVQPTVVPTCLAANLHSVCTQNGSFLPQKRKPLDI